MVWRRLPQKLKIVWNAVGATSNQPQIGYFEARPYSKPAKCADQE